MVLKLIATNSEDDILLCQKNNYITWGSTLTLKQYQHREGMNYASSYMGLQRADPENTNGGVYFILKNQETDNIESACEILIRDCWIGKNGELHNARSAVIGSVYTNEKYRNKGNASIMMRQLLEKMKNKYLKGKYDVAFLYSEVGEYYSKFGYKSFNVEIFKFEITKGVKAPSKSIDHEKVYSDYTEIANDYYKQMEKLIKKKVSTNKTNKGLHFMLKPSCDIFEWFFNRARLNYWAVKYPDAPAPPGLDQEREGYSVDDKLKLVTGFTIKDDNGGLNYIVFYPQFHSNDCYILCMHAYTENTALQLIRLVLQQCSEWGMDKVYGWRTDIGDYDNSGGVGLAVEKALLIEFGGECVVSVVEENDSLSAVQSLHDSSGVVGWEGNGKWCWF